MYYCKRTCWWNPAKQLNGVQRLGPGKDQSFAEDIDYMLDFIRSILYIVCRVLAQPYASCPGRIADSAEMHVSVFEVDSCSARRTVGIRRHEAESRRCALWHLIILEVENCIASKSNGGTFLTRGSGVWAKLGEWVFGWCEIRWQLRAG